MKLTKEIIREISNIKNEPDWMCEFRLKSFEYFLLSSNIFSQDKLLYASDSPKILLM